MPSITTWTRLEPRTATTTLSAVQARIADPLWMLARQWQLGELRGSDTGSAVQARARIQHSRLHRYHAGRPVPGQPAGTPLPDAPLEAVVEAETGPGPATDGALFAARAGQCFLRMLGLDRHGRYGPDYARHYPLATPPAAALGPASRAVTQVLAGRVPDGNLLYVDLAAALRPVTGTGTLPADPVIDPGDRTAVTDAARAWLAWFDAQRPAARPAAWRPDRLEYTFAVNAARPPAGEAVLVADGHRGGDLDWYSFDVASAGSLGGQPALGKPLDREAVPTPVRFPGMPNPRWWEFEDGATNLGALDAAPDDLGRLLLLEFATVYGTDFLYLPVDLDVGSLAWVEDLVVTTTFGDRITVPPVEDVDGAWSMFRLSTAGRPADRQRFLFLPPTAPAALHGADLERVVLLRDEMANLAWAVEARAQDAAGRPVVPRETPTRSAAEPPPAPPTSTFTYRLATQVPEHWQPLVPTVRHRQDSGVPYGDVVLEATGLHEPRSSLLRPGPYGLAEEELPATGLVVTRAWQRTRWTDGSTHAWVGWRRRGGRGEGYSGLRFDTVDGRVSSDGG